MDYFSLMAALRFGGTPSWFLRTNHIGFDLSQELPEIFALKGIPQPQKWHPEGDCFNHTIEVIDRAAELGADDACLFAALVHDLGKAVTPPDNWPHHYNHEALGVPIVTALCERINTPIEVANLAIVVTREHLNVHRFLQMRPIKQMSLLYRLQWVNLDQVGLVCQADMQGRGEASRNEPYPSRQCIKDADALIRSQKDKNQQELMRIFEINFPRKAKL